MWLARMRERYLLLYACVWGRAGDCDKKWGFVSGHIKPPNGRRQVVNYTIERQCSMQDMKWGRGTRYARIYTYYVWAREEKDGNFGVANTFPTMDEARRAYPTARVIDPTCNCEDKDGYILEHLIPKRHQIKRSAMG